MAPSAMPPSNDLRRRSGDVADLNSRWFRLHDRPTSTTSANEGRRRGAIASVNKAFRVSKGMDALVAESGGSR